MIRNAIEAEESPELFQWNPYQTKDPTIATATKRAPIAQPQASADGAWKGDRYRANRLPRVFPIRLLRIGTLLVKRDLSLP